MKCYGIFVIYSRKLSRILIVIFIYAYFKDQITHLYCELYIHNLRYLEDKGLVGVQCSLEVKTGSVRSHSTRTPDSITCLTRPWN